MPAPAPLAAHTSIHTNHYSTQEIEDAVKAFIAPNGPWDNLTSAKNALVRTINTLTANPEMKPHLKSHRDNLTLAESIDTLIGHTGLSGEFGNSIESVIDGYLGENRIIDESFTIKERLNSLTKSLFSHSQLSVDSTAGLGIKCGALQKNAAGTPIFQEYKIAALSRCVDHIEQWILVNAAVIPQEQQTAIAHHIARYRQALPHVLDFVAAAKRYTTSTHQGYANGHGEGIALT